MSKDVIAVATLLGAYAVLRIFSGTIIEDLSHFMAYCFETAAGSGPQLSAVGGDLALQMALIVAKTAGILCAVVIVCAVVATFAQTKLLVTSELLKPKFSRINPLQGFKRLFSLKSIIETLKGILKITLLLIVIYQSVQDIFDEGARYFYADVPTAAVHIFDEMMSLTLKIAMIFAVLAAADFFYQWWEYERNLRMTKEEVKEEYKQVEGNPQIKSKIREVQRRMSRQRMMQQVPQADVVIRNPTHYAVALRYNPEQDNAPIVLALGKDELALRIVSVAEANGIALIENPPLARSLYDVCDLNREIPPELYGAVAEVLVYIFRLNNDKRLGNRQTG